MPTKRIFANLGAALLLSGLLAWAATVIFSQLQAGSWDWSRPWQFRTMLLKGWLTTVELALAALIGSSLVGMLLLLGQRSSLWCLRVTCRAFLELIRETPLLVQLLIGYFVVLAPLLSRSLSAAGWNDKWVIGVILLSLFNGAYLGEILRGGVDSIPQGQWDSARAVGFSPWQIHRHVILPQALRRVLPAIAGQFVSMIKDSSLLSVIGVQEFAYQAKSYTAQTYGGLEAYVPLALGYLILTVPVALLAHILERRFRHET